MKIHTSFDKGRQKGIKKDIHIADIRSLLISYLSKKDWLFYKTEREPETVKHRLQECPMQYTWLSSDHHSQDVYKRQEQLYTGKNKNTGSSQKKQSQSAVLREFLTLNPAALKDMITGEQYETISQSGNIMGEVWESSAPFLRILQRLFQ